MPSHVWGPHRWSWELVYIPDVPILLNTYKNGLSLRCLNRLLCRGSVPIQMCVHGRGPGCNVRPPAMLLCSHLSFFTWSQCLSVGLECGEAPSLTYAGGPQSSCCNVICFVIWVHPGKCPNNGRTVNLQVTYQLWLFPQCGELERGTAAEETA